VARRQREQGKQRDAMTLCRAACNGDIVTFEIGTAQQPEIKHSVRR
jgi:hypothetical protein